MTATSGVSPAAVARWSPIATVVLCVAVCLASYVKSDPAANDFERFDDLRLTTAFFVCFVSLAALYVALVEAAVAPAWRSIALWTAAFAAPLAMAFPVGSRDVFAYAFYGKMWTEYGLDPLLHPPAAVGEDPWFAMLQAWWKNVTAAYGPLFLAQAGLQHRVFGGGLGVAVAGFKIVHLALLAPSAWLMGAIAAPQASPTNAASASRRAATLWLWCPLVLFEALVSGHNDLMMAVLVGFASLLWLRGRTIAAAATLALSFWYKLYAPVLIPLWLFWTWRRWGGREGTARIAGGLIAALVVSGALLVVLDSDVKATLTNLLHHPIAERLYRTELSPPLWVLFHVLEWAGWLGADLRTFTAVRLLSLVIGVAAVIWRRRGSAYDPRFFVEDTALTLAVFFAFGTAVLYPWHLLPLLAFAIAAGSRAWERFAALVATVGLLSYFLTLTFALLLCGLIAGALFLMRRSRGTAAGAPTSI